MDGSPTRQSDEILPFELTEQQREIRNAVRSPLSTVNGVLLANVRFVRSGHILHCPAQRANSHQRHGRWVDLGDVKVCRTQDCGGHHTLIPHLQWVAARGWLDVDGHRDDALDLQGLLDAVVIWVGVDDVDIVRLHLGDLFPKLTILSA